MDIFKSLPSLLLLTTTLACIAAMIMADPLVLSRKLRHISSSADSSASMVADATSSSTSTNNNSNGQQIERMKQILINSKDKIIDFEHGRQMDANDASVRHLSGGLVPNETIQSYIQRNCSSCLAREEAKFARIERIKADLLHKLGLRQPPNATARDLPPIVPHLQGLLVKWGFQSDDVMSDQPMHNNRIDLQPEDYEAKTERVYSFATQPPVFLGLPENKPIAYFKFSPETLNNYVEDAKLHFYIRKPANIMADTTTELVVRLYSVDDRNGKMTEIGQTWFKKESFHSNGHWDKFHLKKLVRHWFLKPERNYGLYVEMNYRGENLVVLPKAGESGKHNMYLEIETKDGSRSKRSKRESPKLDCQERDNETRCCRYPLVIDFESFGWDWVIAPKKYLAYYCSGECPFRHLQRYLHTHLVQQANPKGNVGPCCYPTQMAPILMVYFNENKEVLVSKVPGMVVTRCGCA